MGKKGKTLLYTVLIFALVFSCVIAIRYNVLWWKSIIKLGFPTDVENLFLFIGNIIMALVLLFLTAYFSSILVRCYLNNEAIKEKKERKKQLKQEKIKKRIEELQNKLN